MDVFDDALENEQIGAALARELDAIAVVPFDRAVKHFAIVQGHGHRRVALHLLDPIEVLGVGRLRGRGFLAGARARYAESSSAEPGLSGPEIPGETSCGLP